MEKKYHIHEVSRELGIHENTIRRLEGRGLIRPIRNLVGHRIFTENDIQMIREIYEGKNG